ncbi:TPA: flagellar hook-basal body complex protein FliE [Vibrio vulnificus]|uniref:Flagellar hook-basal body complex protein FliE n=1 Tax=Vibrio vulnificus TaxID=672 RepID=A0A8H9N178_VIBVL|nr:flagellar hook-basal body complex protein FliE [Vibrio vulnificus]HAS8540950.1 flagellar hook-basal body complex protein FliE [Vibrio vulnificus]
MIEPISNASMLSEMQRMSSAASGGISASKSQRSDVSFAQVFAQAAGKVNNAQSAARETNIRFLSGESGVSMADVMQANQKSEITMAAMREVRNQALSGFKEVLNTQI